MPHCATSRRKNTSDSMGFKKFFVDWWGIIVFGIYFFSILMGWIMFAPILQAVFSIGIIAVWVWSVFIWGKKNEEMDMLEVLEINDELIQRTKNKDYDRGQSTETSTKLEIKEITKLKENVHGSKSEKIWKIVSVDDHGNEYVAKYDPKQKGLESGIYMSRGVTEMRPVHSYPLANIETDKTRDIADLLKGLRGYGGKRVKISEEERKLREHLSIEPRDDST